MANEVDAATLQTIAATVQQFYAPWQSVLASDLEVSIISGGLCNRNFRVGLKASAACDCTGPRAVMFRLFGEGTNDLVDRDNEQV
jgi:hypothetical protein